MKAFHDWVADMENTVEDTTWTGQCIDAYSEIKELKDDGKGGLTYEEKPDKHLKSFYKPYKTDSEEDDRYSGYKAQCLNCSKTMTFYQLYKLDIEQEQQGMKRSWKNEDDLLNDL